MSRVVQMTYEPADPALPHVEVLGFSDLRRMNCGVTQRADFLVLGIVTEGVGAVTIDFERYPLAPGTVVWVAPGSVHRWDEFAHVQGRLVLCEPNSPLTAATRASVATPREHPVWMPDAETWLRLRSAVDHLELEVRPDVPGSTPELHAALLTALLARVPVTSARGRGDETFDRFRSAVDRSFRRHRDVGHYARELGYAERTLTRKVVAATGGTAKAYIEARIVLEAKRLLVHHELAAAACAAELGFTDPSAFSVFFRRVTGVRPGAWQRAQMLH